MGALIRSNCSAVSMMLGCRFLLLLVGLAALSHAKSYSKRNFLTTLGFLKKKLSVDQEKQDPSSGSGSLDPSSGSGEIPCMFKCSEAEFVNILFRCDGYPDCRKRIEDGYGKDEEDCENYTYDISSGCGGFQCATGEVIPDEYVCDDYPDCRGDIMCDDYPHCEDDDPLYGEDEKNCEDPSSGNGGLTFGAKEILKKPISQALAKEDLRKTISRARAKEAFMRAAHKRKEAKKSH